MKLRYALAVLALLAVAFLALTYQVNAQRPRNRAKVHSLQATADASGPHPDKVDIAGPATFTCLNAVSETPNSRPEPSCHITAPGFNGTLNIGKTANATQAGAVILSCNGRGNLRCAARVDTPS
ncbi:MAG: hypothetical protein WA192_09260 [Candidatus Acidiferrales bacterium]